MKLKDTFKTHKKPILAIGGCAMLVIAFLLWAWLSAPSTTSTKKADDLDKQATVLQANAVASEDNANVYAAQRGEAHTVTVHVKGALNQRKNDYEQTRKTLDSNSVSGANLDSRERKLQSDLNTLYPANR